MTARYMSKLAGGKVAIASEICHKEEFMLKKGSHLKLIATLQLVNEICNVAFSMSDEEIADLGWCDFMERISPDECPELVTYLKERRLYINEPIYCEAEV